MEYQTSYDTGLKPFNHDKNRGKWASSKDFFFACVGHAFKADAIIILPIFIFEEIGIYALIPYLIVLAVCVVPIVFIQSFLGQFSSTGFISVFRISPLFKGIGYVSLLVNFLTLSYYSVFSAIPLFYFFHSLRPTLPWSCERSAEWMNPQEFSVSLCNESKSDYFSTQIPSVQFFTIHLNIVSDHKSAEEYTFSGQLMVCTCIILAIVTYVTLKSTEFIGCFIRYSFLAVVTIMSICLLRFSFLPGPTNGLWQFLFPPKVRIFRDTWIFVPTLVFATLGPGWGSILTMASFNNFKTDIFRYSWVICLAQLGFIIGVAMLSFFIKHFIKTMHSYSRFIQSHHLQWLEFLSFPTGLTFLEWPHFWSLLFFSMWILGSLNIMIVQLLSLLTSLFDEFEELRKIKRKVILRLAGFFTVTSILFCSNHGVYSFGVLSKYSIITQTILNLLLLLVVLWVYGRERFQRDLNFMTSRIYSTWMIYVVRFVAPIFLILGLLIGFLLFLGFDHLPSPSPFGIVLYLLGTLIFVLSWCLIPGYCIYKIKHTTGIIGMRLRRSVRPTDWYPADPVYKQRYEESFNTTDISHQLTTETMEDV